MRLPFIKKKAKKTKWLNIKAISNNVTSPLSYTMDALSTAKEQFFNHIETIVDFLKSANIFRQDIYHSNMKLALIHLNNKNIFDAKLRYRIAHLYNKTKTEPILGLAQTAVYQKKPKKAIKYLYKAMSLSQNDTEKKQISQIIKSLK